MDDCVASSSKLSLDSGAVEARNRTFVVAALIALAPIALAAADLPARRLQTAFLGSALTVTITADSLLIVLMPVLACSGADWLLRAHPEVRAGEIPFLFPFWIAPAFASLALAVLLTRIPNWPLWVLTLAFGTVLIVVILTAEYVGLSPGSRGYALSRLALTARNLRDWIWLVHPGVLGTRAKCCQRHAHLRDRRGTGA
ncbi:MAG: hypothetical protein IPO29_14515 [Anaerolineae bacterium]|nr:hypothetical protein [Anaerolineae bacterium]